MAVDQRNVVDIILRDDHETTLIVLDYLLWDDWYEFDHLKILQDKLNDYFGYVESGQMVEQFPETQGKPVVFLVELMNSPSEGGKRFFEQAKALVETQPGWSFKFEFVGRAHANPE